MKQNRGHLVYRLEQFRVYVTKDEMFEVYEHDELVAELDTKGAACEFCKNQLRSY